MSSRIASLLPVEEARARALALATPLPAEWARLDEALGRTLAVDVRAQRTLPPWDNSAMDGYAVRSADLTGSLPVRLTVGETIHAGETPRLELRPGTCARIMTGAPLPAGADAVVMQERTRPGPAGESAPTVEILEAVAAGNFVRPRGEDARAGQTLLGQGTPLGIPELGLLAGQGLLTAPVPRRPRVAILSTGDELCRADEPPEGRIVDTNAPALALAVARAGGLPTLLGHRPGHARGGVLAPGGGAWLRRGAHQRGRLRGRARLREGGPGPAGRGDELLARGHQARQAAGRGQARAPPCTSACPATPPPLW